MRTTDETVEDCRIFSVGTRSGNFRNVRKKLRIFDVQAKVRARDIQNMFLGSRARPMLRIDNLTATYESIV
jgi:hypothetical protein